MRVKLTEKGKRVCEELEIPKDVREKFYSLFPIKSKIERVIIHNEGQPEAYIEAIQEPGELKRG